MRVVKGWPFVVCVAIPLVLASLGAINLSSDLLNTVESTTTTLDQTRVLKAAESFSSSLRNDFEHLVLQNANWEDAYAHTAGQGDKAWFDATWGKTISLGNSYDIVAVLDRDSGAVVMGNLGPEVAGDGKGLFGSVPYAAVAQQFGDTSKGPRAVTGFALTPIGPAIIGVAPITGPQNAAKGNGRVLYMAQLLTAERLTHFETRLGVYGLGVIVSDGKRYDGIGLPGLAQMSDLRMHWHPPASTGGGQIMWSKARLILGFLLVVMTGIGYYSWRLVQQLVDDENTAKYKALHDDLTGLPNRSALLAAMRKLQADGKPYAVAFADLDGFKEVNDSYGHEYGDKLLCMVAAGIKSLAGHAVLCCRLGGDEFVVLFAGNAAQNDAKSFANQLIAMLKEPFDMDGRLAAVGASIGIATTVGIYDETEMLRRSDIAMYKAKGSGKNRYCVFDMAFDEEREENLLIANELKTIVAQGLIDIAFQPIVNARTGAISGIEALARWPRSSPKKVPADKFIAIAENSGLIDTLGEAMLDKACQAAKNWPELRLSINISAVQLNNPQFLKRSLAILEKHGIPTGRVEFEITETSLIHDTDRAKAVFKALQNAGAKVALDDFGTGFSSIGYLRTFQFDRIKIDKSIVQKVLSSTSELAIVQGTLLVARGLSAEVTAEGVESDEVAKVLRLAGCTELQGYLYHKPMAAAQITALLARSRVQSVPRTIVGG